MKQKFILIIALIVLIVILIGLNAASYVQQERVPDNEIAPNRSTYNVGSTGTRAFYDLLNESGRKVMRWQEPPSALLNYEIDSLATFVIVGKTQRDFEDFEIQDLLYWVDGGGRLVIIDRGPYEFEDGFAAEFAKSPFNWKISYSPGSQPEITTDPSNQKLMTDSVVAAKPAQPTIYTEKVLAVQPSRFASSLNLSREITGDVSSATGTDENEPPTVTVRAPAAGEPHDNPDDIAEYPAPPPLAKTPELQQPEDENRNIFESGSGSGIGDEGVFATPKPVEIKPIVTPTPERVAETEQFVSPIVHLTGDGKNLLVEFPYGDGTIVFLTDPFIVSNGGINMVDNAQLGINLLAGYSGTIAFDEYHQGYGRQNNMLLAYFESTPVVAIALQLIALIALIFFAQSRRFARALPAGEPDRLSKLEYIGAMAQLQLRTKAFDLAIENIYRDFRRRASRLVGVDNFTVSREDLARLISIRIKIGSEEIMNVMFKCEDIMHGEPTSKKEVISLVSRLREIENELGLRRGR